MWGELAPEVRRDQVRQDEIDGINFQYDPNHVSPHPEGLQPWGPLGETTLDDWTKFVGHKGATLVHGLDLVPPRYPRNETITWNNANGSTSWAHFLTDSLTWEFTKHYLRGRAQVYIDGQDMGIFNLNDQADTLWRVRRTWEVPWGEHVIEVRNVSNVQGQEYTDVYNAP
jgi:hypothetical protein